MHPDIAHPQGSIRGQLSLDCDIPLSRLRIPVIGIYALFEHPTSQLHQLARRDGIRKLEQRYSIRADRVRKKVNGRLRSAFEVVRELPEVRDGENTKAGAKNSLVITKGPIRQTDARIVVPHIELAKA